MKTHSDLQLLSRLPDTPAVERYVAKATPGDVAGEVWFGDDEMLARCRFLPTGLPFGYADRCEIEGRNALFVGAGPTLTVDNLTEPMPPEAALEFVRKLADTLDEIHERAEGHGLFSPASVGWREDGTPVIAVDPNRLAQPSDGRVQEVDCRMLGAVLYRCLGGSWPNEAPDSETFGEIAHSFPRLDLLLRALLRPVRHIRMSPARTVRQTISALLARSEAPEQQLKDWLSAQGIEHSDVRPVITRPSFAPLASDQKNTTPEEDSAPAEEAAPEEDSAPAEEATPEEDSAPAEEATPEEDSVPAEEATPEEDSVPAEEATPEEASDIDTDDFGIPGLVSSSRVVIPKSPFADIDAELEARASNNPAPKLRDAGVPAIASQDTPLPYALPASDDPVDVLLAQLLDPAQSDATFDGVISKGSQVLPVIVAAYLRVRRDFEESQRPDADRLRYELIQLLGFIRSEQAVPTIEKAMSDPTAFVRQEACRALVDSTTPRRVTDATLAHLRTLLDDPEEIVRQEANWALGRLGASSRSAAQRNREIAEEAARLVEQEQAAAAARELRSDPDLEPEPTEESPLEPLLSSTLDSQPPQSSQTDTAQARGPDKAEPEAAQAEPEPTHAEPTAKQAKRGFFASLFGTKNQATADTQQRQRVRAEEERQALRQAEQAAAAEQASTEQAAEQRLTRKIVAHQADLADTQAATREAKARLNDLLAKRLANQNASQATTRSKTHAQTVLQQMESAAHHASDENASLEAEHSKKVTALAAADKVLADERVAQGAIRARLEHCEATTRELTTQSEQRTTTRDEVRDRLSEAQALVTALESDIAAFELESDACIQAIDRAEKAARAAKQSSASPLETPPTQPERPDAEHGHEIEVSIQPNVGTRKPSDIEARDVHLGAHGSRSRKQDEQWLSDVGITGDTTRDSELGSGKWTEPARSREELAAAMGGLGGPRELDLGDAGLPWDRILLAAAVLLVVGGAWFSMQDSTPANASPSPAAVPPTKAQPHVAVESSRAAGADLPSVTITTNVTAARVYLDNEYRGPAPATVVIPVDQSLHQLCIRTGDFEHCDKLTSEQLAMNPVFDFPIVD